MAKRTTKASPPKDDSGALSSFLASVDRFTETISAQVAAVAPEGAKRLTIQATGESLVAQTRKLTDFVRESAARITPGQRRELDQGLRVQDAVAIVNRALILSEQVISTGSDAEPSAPGEPGFLGFLQEIFHLLKKILRWILELIFGAPLPPFWDKLLELLDELFKLLLILLGWLFGRRVSEVADELSRAEVNFLHELTALARLQAVGASGRAAEDET